MIGSKEKTEAAQSIRVEIYNQTYNIRSDGDNEYILRLAEYVDGKMREISSGTLTVDSLESGDFSRTAHRRRISPIKKSSGTKRRAARLAQRGMHGNARPCFETQRNRAAGSRNRTVS